MRQLMNLALSAVLATGSMGAVSLVAPSFVLADSCAITFLIVPQYDRADDWVQASTQWNCAAPGRGGPKVQIQVVKVSTGSAVADFTTPVCGFSCDYHHINAVAHSIRCSSHANTTYRSRTRLWFDDKFGWEPWHNSSTVVLGCLR
jgi:hypothetical protein